MVSGGVCPGLPVIHYPVVLCWLGQEHDLLCEDVDHLDPLLCRHGGEQGALSLQLPGGGLLPVLTLWSRVHLRVHDWPGPQGRVLLGGLQPARHQPQH